MRLEGTRRIEGDDEWGSFIRHLLGFVGHLNEERPIP
jgi:hypothetical protein